MLYKLVRDNRYQSFKPNSDEDKEFLISSGFDEMDSSLFGVGYDGSLFLKSYMNTQQYKDEQGAYLTSINREKEIASLKEYLSSTDYVIPKLSELKLEDESEYEKAKGKYAEILEKRKTARARINELEAMSSN